MTAVRNVYLDESMVAIADILLTGLDDPALPTPKKSF